MHIAFFSDQHPATLGGLQVSLGLQRKYLDAAGHTVTVCSADAKRRPSPQYSRPQDVSVPSHQVGEHAFCMAGPRADQIIDAGFSHRPPVDLVHVQADVWGAWNGYRFARRHGLPVVHTMHTNIEMGLPAVVPFPRTMFRLLYGQQRRHMRTGPVTDMAAYVRAFADSADALIVPSSHFAQRLRAYGVDRDLHVIPTGVDDHQIAPLLARPRKPRRRPVLVWPGRVSQEKRLEDLLRAFALSAVEADLHIYGSGPELQHCQLLTHQLGIADRVRFFGAVSHQDVLQAMRQADAVVQSSLGFETQGLTVYEAISVGTPVLVRDPNIALDLPEAWRHPVTDSSITALATALRQLSALLRTGKFSTLGPAPELFSQSRLTSELLDIYELELLRKDQVRHHFTGTDPDERLALVG